MPGEQSDILTMREGDLTQDYVQTPLRDFIGKLESAEPVYDERFDRTIIHLNFSEVDPKVTTEPYPFPTAVLTIPYSKGKRKISQFGFLLTSIGKVIPGGRIVDLVQKTMRMRMVERNFGRWRGEEADRIRLTWEVVEVQQSVSAVSPKEVALELLNGVPVSNLNPFYQEALKHPVIKEDKDLRAEILSKRFVTDAIEKGRVIVEDGVYKVVH